MHVDIATETPAPKLLAVDVDEGDSLGSEVLAQGGAELHDVDALVVGSGKLA
jgi:hypothetical protein